MGSKAPAAASTHVGILAVDDEPENLGLVMRVLGRQYQLSTFTDADAAANALTSGGDFQVLITDVRMPKMNGIALARHARTTVPSIVVIVISAFAHMQEVLNAQKEGVIDFMISKPWQPAEVRASVERAVLMAEMRGLDRLRDRPPR